MATIDDLDYLSITDKSTDENLETLRQIRLSRRVPVKVTKQSTTTKAKKQAAPELSAEQAAKLLKILEG